MICASRSWSDLHALEVVIGGYQALATRSKLEELRVHHLGPSDQSIEHAIRYVCRRLGVKSHEHPPDYTLGPGAASARNLRLLDDLPVEAVVGFRGEGKTRDMDDMIVLAYARGVPVYEIIGERA